MALVLLIVALVSALTAMRLAIHGHEVTVPDLHGKSPAEAHHIAEDAGLAATIERSYYSPKIPEGKVLSQVPGAGAVVRRGWEIRLALSLGPQRVTVPEVTGTSERAADLTLAQRGIEIESTAHMALPGTEPGQVIGQNPPANSSDVSSPKVSLLISDQVPPQGFVMPNLTGQPLGTVTNRLRDAGFVLGKVTVGPSNSPPQETQTQAAAASTAALASTPSPASIVVSQEPAPGAKIVAGSAVNLVVR